MKITNLPYDCDGFFQDCDYISEENHIVINDRNEVFRNGHSIKLPDNCSLGFPKVKIFSEDYFLLVDANKPYHSGEKEGNAWILDNKGKIEKSLFLGSVNRMILTSSKIIASYSDSLLDTNFRYATNGLVVFDLNGNSLFEYYRDVKKKDRIGLLEVYAFYPISESKINFMVYPELPIYEFDMNDFSMQSVLQIPKMKDGELDTFWNPKGIMKKDSDWYFITPDMDQYQFSRVFRLNSKQKIEEIGRCCFSHSPYGLTDSKFILPNHGANKEYSKCQLIEI